MTNAIVAKIKRIPTVRRLARAAGLIRTSRADPDHYHGDVARGYLDKRLQQPYWHREQEVVADMLQRLPSGISVLDVPIGTGRFVEMCRAREMHVTGLDISQDMLDMARETLGVQVYERCRMLRGDAAAMPFDSGAFDLAICFRFFGLIPLVLAEQVLAELRRVTRRWLVIRVPVRHPNAPTPPPLSGSEPVGGRMYERELLDRFAHHGFRVLERTSVEDRPEVSYVVYLLEIDRSAGQGPHTHEADA